MSNLRNKRRAVLWFAVGGVLMLAGVGGTLALNGFFGGGAAIPEDTMTRGLAGYWSFDEGDGAIARDASGNNNHGTLTNGPKWAQGKNGTALQFDGKDDYVDCGNDASLNITDAITVEAWVKINTFKKNYAVIVEKPYITASTPFFDFNLSFSGTSDTLRRTPRFRIDAGQALSTEVMDANRWYYLVGTYDKNNIKIYVDGELKASVAKTTPINTYGQSLYLGKSVYYTDREIDGQIDEVRIYNRALTEAEVKYHYNRGGPVAQWDMDEGSGSVINDKSGNGNDGTLVNGTTWAQGKHGTALSFDGTDDYVSVPNSSDLDITADESFSYNLWLKTTSTGCASCHFLIKYGSDGYSLHINSGGIRALVNDSDEQILSPSYQINDGIWHYVEVVFDRSTDYMTLYVDGTSRSRTNVATIGSLSNPQPLYLMHFSTIYFAGLIDEVKIYDYARTEEEIRLDYNAGLATHLGPSGKTCSEDPAGCMDFGLAGHWDMDEGNGSILNDKSGNNNHGTLINGPQWTQGKNGNALQFDGKDDYVNCGSGDSLNIYNALSVEAWVKPDMRKYADIVSRYSYSGPTNNGGYSLRFWDDGKFYLVTLNDSQAGISANGVVGKWNHVIATYDVNGGANNLKIYINGTLAGQTTKANALKSITQNLKIGAFSYYHDGSVDGVKIYNRALSAEEVRYHYNQGKPVAQWDMDEGGGSMINDKSGNNNHGTISGATWAQGKHGSALSFDGVNDYVDCGNDASLNITKEITLGFWIKRADVSEKTNQGIIQKENTGGYVLSLNYGTADHKISFISPLVGTRKMATSIDDTEWHHIVCAVNENSSSLKFYIDGRLDSTHATVGTLAANVSSLLIGRRTDYFVGLVDEVKIYDYARTEEEIRLDYNAGVATHLGPSGKTCSEDPAGCMDYGLAGHWDMDEGSGSILNDKSGNNNSCSLVNGPVWSKGKTGSALYFDGENDYANCDTAANDISSVAGTVELWAKADKRIGYVFHSNANSRTYIYRDATGFNVTKGDPGVYIYFPSTPIGEWHHLVLAWDDGVFWGYQDGALIGSQNFSSDSVANRVRIGQHSGGGKSSAFNGNVDEVRIYNRALSAEEVRYHYNQGKPVAQWDFDEGEGTRAFDVSGNNNTGVLTNGPTWVEGKHGSALSFDGTDDSVDVANDSSLGITSNLTIEAWVNPSAITMPSGTWMSIAGKKDGHNLSGYGLVMASYSPCRRWCFVVDNSNVCPANACEQIGRWDHLVGVYDGSKMYLYQNGILQSTVVKSGNIGLSANSFKVASMTSYGKFNGLIDEVKIYNYARTAEQIMQDYNAGLATHLK